VDATGLTSHKNTLCNRMCALPPPPITEPIINYGPELVKNGDFSYPLVPTQSTRLINNNDIENFGWFMVFNNNDNEYGIINNKILNFFPGIDIKNMFSLRMLTNINAKPKLYQLINNITKGEYNLTITYTTIDLYNLLYIELRIDNDIIGYINNNNTTPMILNTFSKNFIINTPQNINLIIESLIDSRFFKSIFIISISLKQVIK
jgi:hypothetical protein